jgi:hypothetical protein
MVVFMSLIVPMPFTWRRRLFNFVSENPLIAKLQYGLKVRFQIDAMLSALDTWRIRADFVA